MQMWRAYHCYSCAYHHRACVSLRRSGVVQNVTIKCAVKRHNL